MLEGLKGEVSITELCRREGIVSNLYYRWDKAFPIFIFACRAGGSGPLHPAADAPILQVFLDALPAPVGTTHEFGRTDPLL